MNMTWWGPVERRAGSGERLARKTRRTEMVRGKNRTSSDAAVSVGDSQEAGFVKNYTQLKVYQLAFESAMRIYELSKT